MIVFLFETHVFLPCDIDFQPLNYTHVYMPSRWSPIQRLTLLNKVLLSINIQPDGLYWDHKWYDDDCREAAATKTAAYKKTCSPRSIVEHCKRRDERRLFRRKKREHERREREEVEIYRCRNNNRNFYQKVKRLTEDFKCGAFSWDEIGNLVTDSG